MNTAHTALDVVNLNVDLPTAAGVIHAVRGVTLSLKPGETLGLVGETGSGKSMTALSLLGLLPPGAQRRAGRMTLGETDLQTIAPAMLSSTVLGKRIGMIFQEPMTSLNPVYTIGRQLMETVRLHGDTSVFEAKARALTLLDKVGVSDAASRLRQYPHQLSGGLRQRVMIAMALMNEPELLIADEPTTALDVTIQSQILELLARLQREFGMSMLLISHDIGVIARVAGRIAVLYAGEVVETGATRDVLDAPRHPYTRGLLACTPDPQRTRPLSRLGSIPGSVPSVVDAGMRCVFAPRCARAVDRCRQAQPPLRRLDNGHDYRCVDPDTAASTDVEAPKQYQGAGAGAAAGEVLLSARGLRQTFSVRRGAFGLRREICAVDGVDLDIHRGEILALVGESGCGKTTLSRILLGLQDADGGDVTLGGSLVRSLSGPARAELVQPIFQDPYASLNPRKTIGSIIGQPLRLAGISTAERIERTRAIMAQVGLTPQLLNRYPAQLSGGQRQRAAIARALITMPRLVICDEPTSALDVSVQAQILNLLLDLRESLQLTYLFITHNLLAVRHIADRVAVMYLGRIVELGRCADVFERPRHPYTRALLNAVLPADGGGAPADTTAIDLPMRAPEGTGCRYHDRCPLANVRCRDAEPLLEPVGATRVRCYFPLGDK